MARGRTTRRWSAEEAREVLEAWKQSGLPLARFARQRGYAVQRLHWWKSRLGSRRAPEIGRFVPVELATAGCDARSPQGSTWIEITLPEGVRLRVPEAADPRSVGRLIAALREARC